MIETLNLNCIIEAVIIFNVTFSQQVTLSRDVTAREETIAAKERSLTEMKKEASELEKLRSVLTYKLNEVKNQLGKILSEEGFF